jgi:hypothetical protein
MRSGSLERDNVPASLGLPRSDRVASSDAANLENPDRHAEAKVPCAYVDAPILDGVFRHFVHECRQSSPTHSNSRFNATERVGIEGLTKVKVKPVTALSDANHFCFRRMVVALPTLGAAA